MSLSIASKNLNKTSSLGYGDLLRFSELVRERCGLHFSSRRRSDLEAGVLRAFAASTSPTLDEYFNMLKDARVDSFEFDGLVNALTIGETHFFRNASQFDALYNHVLPQIIKRKRHMKTLRIWSAGCSSGEEPYSLAMALRNILPDIQDWSITILGTDINTEVLARARKAEFSEWAFREARAKQYRNRYFTQKGRRYVLTPEIRAMVTFERLNLIEDTYPAYETNTTFMDLILCRNVTIYFTQAITQTITDKFHQALNDQEGWLVIGHSEHSITTYNQFRPHNFPNAILYQKVDQYESMVEPQEEIWFPVPEIQDEPKMSDVYIPSSKKLVIDPLETYEIDIPEEEDSIVKAETMLEYGKPDQAREILLSLISEGQDSTEVYMLLSRSYSSLGFWEEAKKWCMHAVERDTLALGAYYTLSLVHQHLGEVDEALEAMKKVVYIDRNYILGHFSLANLHHANQNISAAQKALDNAARLLDKLDENEVIEGSSGTTVGRLRDAIIQSQQVWSMESEMRMNHE